MPEAGFSQAAVFEVHPGSWEESAYGRFHRSFARGLECPLCLGKGELSRTDVLERLGMRDFARVAQLSAEEAIPPHPEEGEGCRAVPLGKVRCGTGAAAGR